MITNRHYESLDSPVFLLLRSKFHLAARGKNHEVRSFLRKHGGTETSWGNVWKNLNILYPGCCSIALDAGPELTPLCPRVQAGS